MAANCGASSASNGLKMRLEYEKMIEILDFLASGKKKIEAAKFFNLPRGTVSRKPEFRRQRNEKIAICRS